MILRFDIVIAGQYHGRCHRPVMQLSEFCRLLLYMAWEGGGGITSSLWQREAPGNQ